MKTEIYRDISPLIHNFKGILLDAFGVFWGGNEFGVLPGAKEMMEKMVQDGKIVGILSNSTQIVHKEIDKLDKYGLKQDKHFHFLVTSGEIVKTIFSEQTIPFPTPNKQFWLFGSDHPKFPSHQTVFSDTSYCETKFLEDADFIYVTTPHINGENQINPRVFLEEVKNLPRNIPMVCANPDTFAQEGRPPRAVVRQGSIAKMYEEIGGKVFYFGKPQSFAYVFAMKHFTQYRLNDPSEILMVGDTPETDIRGARCFGMPSALLLKTGIMSERITQSSFNEAISNIPQSDYPNFFVEALGVH